MECDRILLAGGGARKGRSVGPLRRGWSLPTTLLASILVILGCSNSPSAPREEAVFRIRTCTNSIHAPGGETFRILIRDPGVIAQAQSLIGAGDAGILTGALVRGDGGFNQPWSWHLDPDTAHFAETAIELCDGCPSFVEADLDYWVDAVREYCPWSTEVVARER